MIVPSVALAATTTTAQRDATSWTWTYNAAGTSNYNCLAYAMGYTDRWLWPIAWGSSPSLNTVTSWMNVQGYTYNGSRQSTSKIVVYGYNNAVTHFSKITGSTTCRAKWGQCERFDHGSLAPYYYTAQSYGAVYGYYK
jgi:hypothetical protein